ncbi:hypothetical protein B0T10DRAFT_317763 [Thelonectria olida]|uniref:USP domain-containing protein n=1 Tax=Thelonectria olida TaxID=1576542 RepID=A0A9P9AQX9_9HYPO|nr:hypothetical protein B0T10DRAFT_317763 [Thelonectria olida]
MDLDSRRPELSDRATSAEPSSTRPNPFDDGDISSRKRRRTSLSGSPTTSLDAMDPIHESSSSTTLEGEPADCPTTHQDNHEYVTPQTPEHLPTIGNPPAEPPSSMVTINLRNAPNDDSPTSSPDSPSPSTNNAAVADDVKASVEDTELDTVPDPAQTLDTPQSSSSSSGSPPIEIVTVQSDDDMISDQQSAGVSIVGEDREFVDPIRNFPFADGDENTVETIHRLVQYFATQAAIEDHVLDNIQQWLEGYIEYIQHIDTQFAMDSCRLNGHFWQAFQEIITTIDRRKPPLLTTSRRITVIELYAGFAKLTSWLVLLDHHTVQEALSVQPDAARRCPELLSPWYLGPLHSLIHPRLTSELAQEVDREVAAILLGSFQNSQASSIRPIQRLATGIIDLIPTFPKLIDALAPICQFAADIMGEPFTPPGVSAATQRLEIGHQLHNLVTDTLTNMIEKHVTQLGSDSLTCAIQASSDMLRLSLRGDHEAATDALLLHRRSFPDLPTKYTAEAMVCEERFSILAKLIQSSQMQLRVMGVTTMCSDLVSCWKQYGDGDEEKTAHLKHLAEYLLRTGLIEYILGPNCHPEITVEGANIIGFLVVTKMYRQEHTDLLWQGITSSQDPRVVDALARMTTTILNLFDYNGLMGHCEKLQVLPIEEFTPAIRTLWETIMVQLVVRYPHDRDDRDLTFHPFNLCLRLLRDASICGAGSQVAHPDMQVAAMQKFKDLLDHGPNAEGRQQLYESCIDDISKKSNTTLGSLWCLAMAIRPSISREIHMLTEKHDLTRLIVDELEHAIGAGQSAGVPVVLAGDSNQPRREFIHQILQLESHTLNGELGAKLWGMLVGPQSACLRDREAAWTIISNVKPNAFLQTCLSEYLPALPPACFSAGTLGFVRSGVLPRVNELGDLILDDPESVAKSGIEELWRVVLEANDTSLAEFAISTLAIDIYINSGLVSTYPLSRTRLIHLALVNRCLEQLKGAARKIKASSDGTTSGDDEPMVIVATDEQVQEQERIFTRTLKLLRLFLEAHQSKPAFATPDLRPLIDQAPDAVEVEGASAELKYQSFDGNNQTEVKPLSIGKLNTGVTLLASLRQETGFDNYSIYYRGRPFLPNERNICKSLEDLHVHDGLILVKREKNVPFRSTRVKPGASSVEVEISAHFDELWEYLSMEEKLAEEIYHFLVKLPTAGHILESINADGASYRDVFPPGQPYKSIYAVHAILEYTEAAFQGRIAVDDNNSDDDRSPAQRISHSQAMKTSISLIVQALSDEEVLDRASRGLRLTLTKEWVQTLVRLINRLDPPRESLRADGVKIPDPDCLVELLSRAAAHPGNAPIPLISATLHAMIRLSYLDVVFCEKLIENAQLPQTLRSLLLTDIRPSVRDSAARMIEEGYNSGLIFMANSSTKSPGTSLAQHIWSIVMALVPLAAASPYQCDQVFGLSHSLLIKMNARSQELPNTLQLASKLSHLLVDHVSTEVVGKMGVHDSFARGVTSLLHLCMQLDVSIASSPELPVNFAQDLLWKHLYPRKRSETEQPVPRVILSSETRAKMIEVIFAMVRNDKHQVTGLITSLDSLTPFFSEDGDDPYLYELPNQFDRTRALRSSCGYVGLQNLSNTCYLNSLFTQLFMNTGFRSFIMNSRVREHVGSQQLLFYTQKLFGYMQESYRRFIDPSNVVNSIKTYDDTLIDIHNQMDVDEFYNLLFDRWEGQLVNSVERKKLRSFYGGQLVQQVKSKECEHISERLEPFSAIQCDIKGKSTLQESLQAYVDGEIMEGDNKYKCSTCDKHVDAVKRACLKDIPDNMIFHLKRFDFNLRTLQRSKINDYFQFPSRVNLRPYTIEHLSQPDEDGEEDMFELVGILVHAGTAESGHYYSYIRERPSFGDRQNWVEFNDDLVTPWDPAQMENSTFGGPERVYDNTIQYDKTYSAYMLFYQRASSLRAEQEAMKQLNTPVPLRVDIPGSLREHILDENTVILRRHCLFDPSHTKLVHMLFNRTSELFQRVSSDDNTGLTTDEKDHQVKDLAMKMVVSNFDQIVTRVRDIPDFPAFTKLIHDAIARCSWCAVAFFEYFDKRRESLRALLLRNPDNQVRTFMSKIFIWSLERISVALPDLYNPKSPGRSSSEMDEDVDEVSPGQPNRLPFIEATVHIFNHLWRFFHIHIKAWDEFFAAILGFVRLGSREAAHILAGDYLAKILKIIAADPLMKLPPNYARMLQTIMRRASNRGPPSYMALIPLINYLLHQLEPQLGPDVIVEEPTERLENMEAPFNWTSEEVELVHSGFDSGSSSLFTEKLLSIDQAPDSTDRIIEFLVRLSPEADMRVLATLKRCIRGDSSTQMMDPFLRAARVYLENTEQFDCATKIVQHIFVQAKSLQNTEGPFFVQFFNTALHLQRPEAGFNSAVRTYALKLVPRWTPLLLAARDATTRVVTKDFLDRELFQEPQDDDDDETFTEEDDDEVKVDMAHIKKSVGTSCLLYLQENHLRRRVQLKRGVADLFMYVVGQCVTAINTDTETQDNLDCEFLMLQQDVMEPLRRITVDDVEDDGSGMFQSLSDSDTMTADMT